MELFQVADRFGIDRLKTLCEQEMLRAIDIDSAAHILYTADEHHAEVSILFEDDESAGHKMKCAI